MGLAARLVDGALDARLGHGNAAAQAVAVGASIGVGVAVLYAACRLLRVKEMDEALAAFWPSRFAGR